MIEFAQPAFLFALTALAVPLAIHLVSRMLAPPWVFPSVRFIPVVPVPRRERRRPGDLLLLAARLALITATVVALARPCLVWPGSDRHAASGAGVGRAIVAIDLSSSMGGWGGLDGARARARDWLARTRAAEVGLLTYARGVVHEESATRDRDALRRALTALRPFPQAGDPGAALRRGAAMLAGGRGPLSLAVISDFQESDWASAQLPALADHVALELERVGTRRPGNVCVSDARVSWLAPGRVRVTVTVAGDLDRPATIPLRIDSGGARWDARVDLAGRAPASIDLDVAPEGEHPAVASVPADLYPADDRFHFWLGRPPALQVCFVVARSVAVEVREERFFVQKAVEAGNDTGWVRREFVPVAAGALTPARIAGATAVIVPAPTAASGELPWPVLIEHVRAGGLLLLSVDGRAPAVLHALAQAGLVPARYTGLADAAQGGGAPLHPSRIRPGTSLAEVFEGNKDLFLVCVRRYARLDPAEGWEAAILLDNGDPFLVTGRLGAGSVALFALPLDATWSDLPLRASFLPMIREILAERIPIDGGVARLEPGSPLPPEVVARLEPGRTHPSTAEPGAFRVGPIPVEINVPRSESAPEIVPEEEARAWLPGGGGRGVSGLTDADVRRERCVDLWPWLVTCAALLFLAENAMVGWMDRSGWAREAER